MHTVNPLWLKAAISYGDTDLGQHYSIVDPNLCRHMLSLGHNELGVINGLSPNWHQVNNWINADLLTSEFVFFTLGLDDELGLIQQFSLL